MQSQVASKMPRSGRKGIFKDEKQSRTSCFENNLQNSRVLPSKMMSQEVPLYQNQDVPQDNDQTNCKIMIWGSTPFLEFKYNMG